ncbi:hypothetical protein BDW74DRAFT_179376 [Aspergillus multicolor]|uniref:uncharacterized protein n=1 Tax=Aspergillus multicolor TaxID=41759 RepID=UPI003CCD0FC0
MLELLGNLGKITAGAQMDFQPFLLLVARQKSPSVDLLKVIIKIFHADINI